MKFSPSYALSQGLQLREEWAALMVRLRPHSLLVTSRSDLVSPVTSCNISCSTMQWPYLCPHWHVQILGRPWPRITKSPDLAWGIWHLNYFPLLFAECCRQTVTKPKNPTQPYCSWTSHHSHPVIFSWPSILMKKCHFHFMGLTQPSNLIHCVFFKTAFFGMCVSRIG